MTRSPRPDSTYELTVVGRVGPVVRGMLEAASTTSCGLQTIMCLRGLEGEDLVDLLHLLGSRGLDVISISTVR